jgi:hypothetical protein
MQDVTSCGMARTAATPQCNVKQPLLQLQDADIACNQDCWTEQAANSLLPLAVRRMPCVRPAAQCRQIWGCPHDAAGPYFLAVMADFLAPRSFLTRFFRSFMFLRDRCTLVSSPFCSQQ